jgi:hypothetical protein
VNSACSVDGAKQFDIEKYARTAGHYRRTCETVSGCLNCRVGW